MKLLLYLCIVSSVYAGFDVGKCTAQFGKLIGFVSLKESQLETICASPEQTKKKTDELRTMLTECGLENWQSSSQDPKERRIGSVVEGLFKYLDDILCMRRKNSWNDKWKYCYPGAVKIFDTQYILKIVMAMQNDEFDAQSLNLKCSVMGNKQVVKAICPGGPKGSAKRKCQEDMVKHFEVAVRTVQWLIAEYDQPGPGGIIEELQPLLSLAMDVKLICKEKSRKKARRLVKKVCAAEDDPTNPPDDPEFPVCLTQDSITNECLRDQICQIDTELPQCNTLTDDVSVVLATHENYQGLFQPQFTLPDGSVLDRKRARRICCSTQCVNAIADGNWCERGRYSAKIEIIKNGVDIWEDIQKNPEKMDEYSEKICINQACNGGTFDPIRDCKVRFTKGRKGSEVPPESNGRRLLGRRLLSTTQTVIATIDVNSSSTTPFNCEADGTFFGFDDALASNSSSVSLQVGMNVTEGQCQEVDSGEESSSDMGGGTGSSTSDAMQFSISFVTMFFCLFFAMNDSNM